MDDECCGEYKIQRNLKVVISPGNVLQSNLMLLLHVCKLQSFQSHISSLQTDGRTDGRMDGESSILS